MSMLNLAYVLYTHLHFVIFFPVVNTYCASSLKRSLEISKIAYFLILTLSLACDLQGGGPGRGRYNGDSQCVPST